MGKLSRSIGIFSGKGGVGKTTLVANLASALTKTFNRNAIVFDTNIHTSHIGFHFGLYEDLPVTLREVLKGRSSIMQAVYVHPQTGIRMIPAPLNNNNLELTKDKCGDLVNQIKKNYDTVILDCPPGLGREVMAPMSAIDEAIVVSTPDISSLTDSLKTIEILRKMKKNILGVVVNRYRNQKYELTPQEISSTVETDVIGIIPEDMKVPESISKGLPVVLSYPNAKSSNAFNSTAAFVIGETYTKESMWSRIRNVFKKHTVPVNAPLKEASHAVEKPSIQVKEERVERKKPEPAREEVKKEAVDIKEIREDVIRDVKNELRQEILKKVKKRLQEEMNEPL